ncbi:MAG TPA: alternative ribosome rescue aminoacyl-tRNA hydrolase ArfB [Phycisphaerae bacterium]|nr:alternative ribosome rescue aminoacyl-tRNA hydrolase ArfB [Phycisphaerae bacterium]
MRIPVAPGVAIDEDELRFTFTRSGGPGGQNVNKVNTCVTVWFDVRGSASLSAAQKARIAAECAGRINADGVLRVACQRFRTQSANRRAVVRRLAELIAQALRPRVPRRPTRPTRGSAERRLRAKRRRAERKKERSAGRWPEL